MSDTCIDCGAKKKTAIGQRCHTCASRFLATSQEYRAAVSAGLRGKPKSAAHRAAIGDALRGTHPVRTGPRRHGKEYRSGYETGHAAGWAAAIEAAASGLDSTDFVYDYDTDKWEPRPDDGKADPNSLHAAFVDFIRSLVPPAAPGEPVDAGGR